MKHRMTRLCVKTNNSTSTRVRECLLINARMTWLYSQATRHHLEQGSACSSRLEWPNVSQRHRDTETPRHHDTETYTCYGGCFLRLLELLCGHLPIPTRNLQKNLVSWYKMNEKKNGSPNPTKPNRESSQQFPQPFWLYIYIYIYI
jgi:hypothetical protein